ncbi:MAG: hypothetical protein IPM29_25865 [Planctomycetes bacterium]|nr:hypothetical protein [Planctomycetota bacterium]
MRQMLWSVVVALAAGAVGAQTEGPLVTVAQTGIGSNGFGTFWRGQDVELAEDAWLTRIVFQTGSATAQVDEIRLMTATPQAVTLRTITTITTPSSTEAEAVLTDPFLLRVGTRYTIWFHQTGTPRGTYGCDLTRVDPTWRAYHTNVDPTVAPGGGEPSYYWGYQYGTNFRLLGWDNLEITGSSQLGGTAIFTLEAPPFDLAVLFFASAVGDQPLPPFRGPLRLALASIVPAAFAGAVDPNGQFVRTLTIPNDPRLVGIVVYAQALHDPSFVATGTFSPLDEMRIR